MSIFKLHLKTILLILFVTIFFSTLNAKNIDKFYNGNNISNYFSGILLLNDNFYDESHKYLKKLNGLEESHLEYTSKYLFSLVNSGKFREAYNYSKKIESKKLDSFESDLIIGIYNLKEKKYDLANKYFLKLKKRNSGFILSEFITESLLTWSSVKNLSLSESQKRIDNMDSRFENLKNIQNVFLHCHYNSSKTEFYFKKLTTNLKTDFSRYNYFYSNYLINQGEIEKAEEFLKFSINLYPRNLLLNQQKINLINNKIKNNFNCKDQSHVVAEIFYITANALSSQSYYTLSNFYINVSKFLNEEFFSYNTLLAENYYKIEYFDKAKKIYNDMKRHGEVYSWYAAKQNARILIKENKKEKALKQLSKAYEKFSLKNIYETYDYADFLKNNEKFEESIKYYTKIIKDLKTDHPLFPQATEGRGIAYERVGDWEKAEKDLLKSLKVKPDQAYVINYLAYSWIEKGINIEKSLKMLEEANRLRKDDPYIIDSLGWALYKLKKYKEAKKYLQIAVELMPADPIVNDHFGDVLWKNGHKIQARYYWNYVLKLKKTKEDQRKKIENKLVLGL
tara:strand:+ start:9071 stop:10765 length:1695 start_codon:yes stop_codon:yes gene_type:complete